MDIINLGHDSSVASIIEVQRALSTAQSSESLSFELGRRLRSLAPVTHAVSLDVQGLEPGWYRRRYLVDLASAGFSPGLIAATSTWDMVDVRTANSPALADILATPEPRVVRRVADDGWGPGVDGADAAFVPVFAGGEVVEWVALILPPDFPFDARLMQVVLVSINAHARLVQQVKLTNRIEKLAAQRDDQLRRVGKLQRSILPTYPGEVPGLEVATHYSTCHAAGGDYYDFRVFEDGKFGAMVADVAGHGPDAAVVMAMIRAAMAAYRLAGLPPVGTAQHLNRILHDALPPGLFVTAQFVLIDPRTGEGLTLVAGHPPGRIKRRGAVEPLGIGLAPPLGIEPVMPPDCRVEFHIDHDETILLYTDGVTESRSPDGEFFGVANLDRALAGTATAHETIDHVLHAVKAHTHDASPLDDRCMVAIHRE